MVTLPEMGGEPFQFTYARSIRNFSEVLKKNSNWLSQSRGYGIRHRNHLYNSSVGGLLSLTRLFDRQAGQGSEVLAESTPVFVIGAGTLVCSILFDLSPSHDGLTCFGVDLLIRDHPQAGSEKAPVFVVPERHPRVLGVQGPFVQHPSLDGALFLRHLLSTRQVFCDGLKNGQETISDLFECGLCVCHNELLEPIGYGMNEVKE